MVSLPGQRSLSAMGRAGLTAWLLLASTAAIGLATARAEAADPSPGGAQAEAFRAFVEGQHAFEAGDFRGAATSFEAAYRAAPHPDVLWNAARAWDRAGESARAANLYDRYLEDALPAARDRDAALKSLQKLAVALGRLDVVRSGLDEVSVDDQPLARARVYVTPGAHLIRGRAGDARLSETASVAAGQALSVALSSQADQRSGPDVPPTIIVVPGPIPPQNAALPGFRRVLVGAGIGATAVAAGLLIWSGADTLSAKSTFDREGTPQALEDGQAKQRRTNALIGVTAGLGAATAVVTVVFLATAPVEARASVTGEGLAFSLRARF